MYTSNGDLQLRQNMSLMSKNAPPPSTKTGSTRGRKARLNARNSNLTPSIIPPSAPSTPVPTLPTYTIPLFQPITKPNPPLPPLPTTTQALQTTYASRLRTGATLLMQPIITASAAAAAASAAGTSNTRAAARRGGMVNYADPGSGDDIPDAGALDSDDSDFVASGGTRTSVRQSRQRHTTSNRNSTPQPAQQQSAAKTDAKAELDQSYLGMHPPDKFIRSKAAVPTPHEYPSEIAMAAQASKPTALVPIRVEFETDSHRIRDCFVWNLNETLIKPESFARTFCADLDLPSNCVDIVTNQIRAQLEEHEGIASMELRGGGADVDMAMVDVEEALKPGEDIPECRVIVSIDVQIATYHLLDHIEWDLLSPLTPEAYARTICAELGLSGEAVPLIAHAVHEELIRHKKDAVEWGFIGGDDHSTHHRANNNNNSNGNGNTTTGTGTHDGAVTRGVKDKTGLGFGWGRTARDKDGRGPRVLRSVWRDWSETEEFTTRFEVLSAEEVERREYEKERASRRLRRETSKFQSTRSSRRR